MDIQRTDSCCRNSFKCRVRYGYGILPLLAHLKNLVDEDKVELALIDDAVKRILKVKFELGFLMILTNIVMKREKKRYWYQTKSKKAY